MILKLITLSLLLMALKAVAWKIAIFLICVSVLWLVLAYLTKSNTIAWFITIAIVIIGCFFLGDYIKVFVEKERLVQDATGGTKARKNRKSEVRKEKEKKEQTKELTAEKYIDRKVKKLIKKVIPFLKIGIILTAIFLGILGLLYLINWISGDKLFARFTKKGRKELESAKILKTGDTHRRVINPTEFDAFEERDVSILESKLVVNEDGDDLVASYGDRIDRRIVAPTISVKAKEESEKVKKWVKRVLVVALICAGMALTSLLAWVLYKFGVFAKKAKKIEEKKEKKREKEEEEAKKPNQKRKPRKKKNRKKGTPKEEKKKIKKQEEDAKGDKNTSKKKVKVQEKREKTFGYLFVYMLKKAKDEVAINWRAFNTRLDTASEVEKYVNEGVWNEKKSVLSRAQLEKYAQIFRGRYQHVYEITKRRGGSEEFAKEHASRVAKNELTSLLKEVSNPIYEEEKKKQDDRIDEEMEKWAEETYDK